jgi:hypothetical protein
MSVNTGLSEDKCLGWLTNLYIKYPTNCKLRAGFIRSSNYYLDLVPPEWVDIFIYSVNHCKFLQTDLDTIYIRAVRFGRTAIIRYLLKRGVSELAIIRGNLYLGRIPKNMNMLISNLAGTIVSHFFMETALGGRIKTMSRLLDIYTGVNKNMRSLDWYSIRCSAANGGSVEMVKYINRYCESIPISFPRVDKVDMVLNAIEGIDYGVERSKNMILYLCSIWKFNTVDWNTILNIARKNKHLFAISYFSRPQNDLEI